MILKAGTYRFNDVLDFSNLELTPSTPFINEFNFISNNKAFVAMALTRIVDGGAEGYQVFYADNMETGMGINAYLSVMGYTEGYQENTLPAVTEVDDTFGTWYIANTNYNEVNGSTETPLATIEYNGETIAQLNAGETCTLKCAGLPMETDIIIKINEVN